MRIGSAKELMGLTVYLLIVAAAGTLHELSAPFVAVLLAVMLALWSAKR